jgi:hypothetical protein
MSVNILLPTCLCATWGHAITRMACAELAVAVVALYLLADEHNGTHGEEEAMITH